MPNLVRGLSCLTALSCIWVTSARADDFQSSLAQQRQLMAEDNPAELAEAKGQQLWSEAMGPRKVSLERCDLGMGPGVVKGAYAQLPRYFADTDRVQDLESRLVTCRVTLQGYTLEDARRAPFAANSDMQALVAYVAGQSRGVAVSQPLTHPKEQQAYALGQKLFYYRAGTHDFACVTCHGTPNKRIRLQYLPDLTQAADTRATYTSWPAYRISQGETRSLEHRLWDCFRQQRFPDLVYTSDAVVALNVYLAKMAEGGVMNAPGLKR